MPFVKLDIGILDSSLRVEPEQRIIFITALCMALPYWLPEPAEELETESIEKTGFIVPPGWYGIVRASSWGIIGRTWPHDKPDIPIEQLMRDLKELSLPDPWSRSDEFEGRRMVRISGGFLILNFSKYREMDRTAAERAKRYRENKASRVTNVTQRKRTRDKRDAVTQAEAEAEAEAPTINPSPSLTLPPRLDTPKFKAAWAEWIEFRKQKKKPISETGAKKQIKILESYGPDIAVLAIDQAIASDWQGLFPEKINGQHPVGQTFKEAAQAREAELHKKQLPGLNF
jgi:hypothetical protein